VAVTWFLVVAWLLASTYLFTHPLKLRGFKRKTQLKIMLLVFASQVMSLAAVFALAGECLTR